MSNGYSRGGRGGERNYGGGKLENVGVKEFLMHIDHNLIITWFYLQHGFLFVEPKDSVMNNEVVPYLHNEVVP